MSEPQNAEVLRLLSQMIKENGEFRAETKGELASLRQEMGSLRQEMNERFDKLEASVVEIEWGMKHLLGDLLKIHAQLDRNEDRVRKLEGQAA